MFHELEAFKSFFMEEMFEIKIKFKFSGVVSNTEGNLKFSNDLISLLLRYKFFLQDEIHSNNIIFKLL